MNQDDVNRLDRLTWHEGDIIRLGGTKTFSQVLKFNKHHDEVGRFASAGGSLHETQVGITSAGTQPGAQPHTRDVLHSMQGFAKRLKALGVANVAVVKGTGVFFGKPEPTWVTAYNGNGRAYKLLAEMGRQFNQDAVLIMRKGDTDALVDMVFEKKVSTKRREHIQREMTKHGIVGGTWFQDAEGYPVLRMASVQAWGGDKQQHLDATQKLKERLAKVGIKAKTFVHGISTEVLDRDRYAEVLK